MKYSIIGLLLLTISSYGQEQYNDYFVAKNYDTIKCAIYKLKEGKFYFKTNNEEYKKKKLNKQSFKSRKSTKLNNSNQLFCYLNDIRDIKITDTKVIYNPKKIEIKTPKKGYAHVYFYRPLNLETVIQKCKIKYKKKDFISLRANSYHLHVVKSGMNHVYQKTNFLNDDKYILIEAKDQGIYFIRGTIERRPTTTHNQNLYTNNPNLNNGLTIMSSKASITIEKDESNLAKYRILGMKKKSKVYKQ